MITLPHGGDLVSARARIEGQIVDFSANVSPLGLPDGVRAAAARALDDSGQYPDPLCRALTAALAEHESVPPEWILCGNGASDLIYRLAYALRPRTALLAAPCFSEYGQAVAAAGGSLRRHLLREEEEFRLTGRILGEMDGVDALFLCTPNNPTGQPVERGLLHEILVRCGEQGIFVALDECFVDFLDEPEQGTAKDWLRRFPHLLILRAFTKLYAMAGLRLGYGMCADRTLLERMYRCGSPWSVSGEAQAAGIQALRETEYTEAVRRVTREGRARLRAGLESLGCRVYGSQANYLFFRPPVDDLPARLERRGILIRSCDNYAGLPRGYCRAGVRCGGDNELLLRAVEEVLAWR